MRVALPSTLDEAVDAAATMPGSALLAGGTDFCVEVNFGHRKPTSVVCLRRVGELRRCEVESSRVVIGGGMTYTAIVQRLSGELPALAAAARTVGSPQIRNAGTVGGNVGTASPAGDTLPLLAALDAEVVLRGPDGTRSVALRELLVGVKRTQMAPGEIVVELNVARIEGPQQFLKVGTRNAMVIGIASCAVVLDTTARVVRCGLGSVGPVPVRPAAAEAFAAGELDWDRLSAPTAAVERFAEMAAAECAPISDHRASAEYRRKAVQVIVARAMRRCLGHVR